MPLPPILRRKAQMMSDSVYKRAFGSGSTNAKRLAGKYSDEAEYLRIVTGLQIRISHQLDWLIGGSTVCAVCLIAIIAKLYA
jgi:hypothetical protein